MKYNDNGTYKDIYVKAFDTLPVGSEVDYDGTTVPDGWTEVADPNTYSTDEVGVGTWIDGKPLYRKVLTDTSTTSGDHSISLTSLSFDYITIKNFRVKSGNYVLNLYGDQNSNDKVRCFINTNTKELIWSTGSAWANASFTAIIEYTKTTD